MADLRDRLPDFREFLNPEYWRTHAVEAGYLACGLVFFVIFLAATFPYSDALSHALAPLGMTVTSSGQKLALPFGAELQDVRVMPLATRGAAPLLESDSVKVAPSLLSFLMLHPGVTATAQIDDGVVTVSARRSGDGTRLGIDATGLNMAQFRGLASIGANVAGFLAANGVMQISGDGSGAQNGDLALNAGGVTLKFGPTMPAIRLGDLNAKLTLDGQQLSVQDLKNTDGDLAVSGGGVITLAPNWSDSPINLKVKITPTPAAQARLAFLSAMLPPMPDGQPYHIIGTLGSPQLFGLNLPTTARETPPPSAPARLRARALPSMRRPPRPEPAASDDDDSSNSNSDSSDNDDDNN
ncbi:MAG TPA: type II secretion system protein GspN [Candidatus Binataceae bacterium]